MIEAIAGAYVKVFSVPIIDEVKAVFRLAFIWFNIAKNFLPENEYWRIVKLDLDSDDNIVDWTHEREWRIKGDFHFELSEVEILLSDQTSLKKFNRCCKEKNMENLLNEIKGIVILKSLLF